MSHKFYNDEIGWYILIKVASGSGQVSTEVESGYSSKPD
jgi:hypothetical protein